MNELMIVANVAIVFGVTYKLFELFACRKERILMIEKMCEKLPPELLAKKPFSLSPEFLAKQPSRSSAAGLRLGCLMVGLGVGLLLGFVIVHLLVWNPTYSVSNVVYGACVLLGGGSGLLASYILENKWMGKREE